MEPKSFLRIRRFQTRIPRLSGRSAGIFHLFLCTRAMLVSTARGTRWSLPRATLRSKVWDSCSSVLAAADAHVITVKRGLEGVVVPSKMYGILAARKPIVAVAPRETDAVSLGIQRRLAHCFQLVWVGSQGAHGV